jgi:3-oxoacyl-[acyl-carrier protein] reductase
VGEHPVAIVTGATGLLGGALVDVLSEDGYAVVAHGRRERPDEWPESVTYVAGDLRNEADVAMLVEAARNRGVVRALVNNAADMDIGRPWPMAAADWLAILDASLVSTVRVTQALLPHLAAESSIVNISSIEAASAFPSHAHYAAAKAALESYTRSLALELAPNKIRANALAPGVIDRPGLAKSWPEGWSWWSRTCPLGRAVTAREVADVAGFLASAKAAGVNGSVIPVDGGWSASARFS